MSGRADALDAVPGLRSLLVEQDHVMTRRQLRALGVTPQHVARQVAARRWWRIGPRVVVLHHGPLSWAQRSWVAVLGAGDGAGLTGLAALRFEGLRWQPRRGVVEPIDVVLRREARPRPMPGVVVHRPRRPGRMLPAKTGVPPRLAVEEAVIDAALGMDTPREAAGVMLAVLQQRLTTVDRVQAALRRRGRVRGTVLLAGVLADASGGAAAVSEVDMARLCRRAGLRDIVAQETRTDSAGVRRYIDMTVRLPDGRLLRIEVDGSYHLDARAAWADMERHNRLVISGAELWLRFPTLAVRCEPDAVVAQLREIRIAAERRAG